jgi:hypothetical protein
MILYHASDVVVEIPEIRRTVYTKDFGWGFYCTASYSQAERWARRDRNLVSVVNYYSYELVPGLAMKQFPVMTDEWLDFIAACRSGKEHDWDLVEGPMANDTIYNYVQDFIDGRITRSAFWELAKFKHPTHQICFCTERALASLKFDAAEEVYDG